MPGLGLVVSIEPSDALLDGLVTRSESGFYTVHLCDGGQLVCRLRGRLRKERTEAATLVAIGDRVRVLPSFDGEGSIEEVLPRSTELARRAAGPGRKHWLRQTLAANLDLLVVVTSLASPDFNAARLDRYLVVAEDAAIPPVICLNKCDRGTPDAAEEVLGLYAPADYPRLCTSAVTGAGITHLRELLHGRHTAFVGASGTGKSSLLNALLPDAALRTGGVNMSSGRGRHTTTVSQLLRLDDVTWVADTPGLRELAPWGLQRDRLPWLFPEIRQIIAEPCRYPACTHRFEPGCRVVEAVEAGLIPVSRHTSYVKLWDEAE